MQSQEAPNPSIEATAHGLRPLGQLGSALKYQISLQPAARIGLKTDAALCIKLRRFQERSQVCIFDF